MIVVNTRAHPWQEGMTIQSLLDEKQYHFKHIIVRINGTYVPEESYTSTCVNDGDNVQVLHLMAGG